MKGGEHQQINTKKKKKKKKIKQKKKKNKKKENKKKKKKQISKFVTVCNMPASERRWQSVSNITSIREKCCATTDKVASEIAEQPSNDRNTRSWKRTELMIICVMKLS